MKLDQTTASGAGAPRPPNLYFDMTGETFEFQTSAKAGDGVFRFRWTLQPGKKGPPAHVHDDERETFTIVSGRLCIWLGKEMHDLGPGQSVTVERGVVHRFHNRGSEPVVVDVSLDGPKQEDALVPLAVHCAGRRKLTLKDFFTMMAHADVIRASQPAGRVGRVIMAGVGKLARLLGGKPLATVDRW